MNFPDYIKGNKKGKNAHRIEYEAMKDPFLSDAIEGYETISSNHIEKITHLQKKITKKSKTSNQVSIWWSAACLLLLVSIGTYLFLPKKNDIFVTQEISLKEQREVTTEKSKIENLLESEKQEQVLISPHKVINSENSIPASENIQIQSGDIFINDESAVEESHSDFILSPFKDEKEVNKEYHISKEQTYFLEKGTENTIPVRPRLEEGKIRHLESVARISLPESSISYSNKKEIKGKIVNENGESITGAMIVQKGTNNGTVTDFDGNFSLKIDSVLNDAIAISYLGYKPIEVKIDKKNPMLIAMHENSQIFDEIVASGYGTSKKQDNYVQKNKKPEPIIGMNAFKNYLKKNVKQPTDAICANVAGKVMLTFYINESGLPYIIQIKKSLCPSCDQAAIELLQAGGTWTTGNQQVEIEVIFNGNNK